jgi:hypothetical protein
MLSAVNAAAATAVQIICFFISEVLIQFVFDDFDGQGVQALIYEFLQRIIHKAMPRDPRFAYENVALDTHPKVCALTRSIRTGVTSVVGTLV